MKLEMSTYLAGVATAALAIAAGFGGGVIIANSFDTNGAVPAAGMSRIERTKREEPKLAAIVETSGQAPRTEEPAVNPLAEATPPRVNAGGAEPAPEKTPDPSPAKPIALQTEPQPNAATLPAAIQTISSPRGNRREARRARHAQRPRVADEPNTDSQKQMREVARYREGGVRYTIRTANGRPAQAGEVEQLKRELRARREGNVAENRALSYGPERRGMLLKIFPD
jgi:hypothetical protein